MGPTAVGKSNITALLCLPRLASELSVGHCLTWEGENEVKEEEEEEHAKDGMNNKLVNPAADDGARHDGGCGRRHAAGVRRLSPGISWHGRWIKQANGRQIAVHATPLIVIVVETSSYCTIRYSISEAKYSKYDCFAYIRRNSIVQKIVHSRNWYNLHT
jgi:hypothetical protein